LPLRTLRDIPGRFPRPGHLTHGEFARSGGSPVDQGVPGAATVGTCDFLITWPSPGFPARPPIDTAPREDARSWEITPPAIRGSHHSYFVHMFYLPYIITILLACSKSMIIKIWEIIYIYNTSPCRIGNAVNPAKCALKRTRIELATLDFRPGAKRALPAHRAD